MTTGGELRVSDCHSLHITAVIRVGASASLGTIRPSRRAQQFILLAAGQQIREPEAILGDALREQLL
jgi:hypothetical protein